MVILSRLARTCLQFGTLFSPPALLIYSPSCWLCSPLLCFAWCKGLCVVAFKQFQFGTNHKPHETERARDREASEWVREREKERRHLLNSLTSTQMNIQLLYRRKEREKERRWEKEKEWRGETDNVLCPCMNEFIKSVFDFTISKALISWRHNSFIKRWQSFYAKNFYFNASLSLIIESFHMAFIFIQQRNIFMYPNLHKVLLDIWRRAWVWPEKHEQSSKPS